MTRPRPDAADGARAHGTLHSQAGHRSSPSVCLKIRVMSVCRGLTVLGQGVPSDRGGDMERMAAVPSGGTDKTLAPKLTPLHCSPCPRRRRPFGWRAPVFTVRACSTPSMTAGPGGREECDGLLSDSAQMSQGLVGPGVQAVPAAGRGRPALQTLRSRCPPGNRGCRAAPGPLAPQKRLGDAPCRRLSGRD